MSFVAFLRLLLFISSSLLLIQESTSTPHEYYSGRSYDPFQWSGSGNGYGNVWASDNVNAGIGGTGGTVVSQEVQDDGTIIERNGWNKGINGNANFMKSIGGSKGYFGQPFYGQGRGKIFGGGGVNGGLGANGGSTVIRRVGQDGSYIYGKENNLGVGGNLGAGLTAGGMGGGSAFGPCGYGACGHGGIRGNGYGGLSGGLNANNGYYVENKVLPNGGYVKTTNSKWGLNGNLGAKIGVGVDGGWRGKVGHKPSGRSFYMDDDSGYYQEPTYVQQQPSYEPYDYEQPRQEHPYMKTLEGMYSREMNPQASIIMIDDPVVIIMPDEAGESPEGKTHDGDDSSTESTSTGASSTEGGSSTTSATSTEGGSSTTSATSTEAGSSTTAASSTDGSTTDGSTTEGETTTEGDTTTEGETTTEAETTTAEE